MTAESNCPFCFGKTALSQFGIMKVFLFPNRVSLLMLALGLALALSLSKYWLALSAVGLILPLANADFRMYLYPVAALGRLLGREVNCPKCAATGTIFK